MPQCATRPIVIPFLARCLCAASLALPAVSFALTPAKQPERVSCDREGKDLRSREAKRSTKVEFINRGDKAKTIYWLNYAGLRVYYAKLQPNESYVQHTYVTHPWIATSDELGTCEVALRPIRSPSSIILN